MWVSAILLLGLLIYCYWFGISEMLDQWTHDEDMGHGFLVPLFAGWIAWSDRKTWKQRDVRPSWWGFVPLLFSALLLYVAIAGAGRFVACVALLLAISGIVVILGGPTILRRLAFPLLLLIFMLPKLAIVYNQVTLPLQLLATHLASLVLSAGGMHVVQSGNILHLDKFSVSVVEACSGIRYLLSLSFMALVYGYFAGSGPGLRVILMFAMAPLAILANAFRVAVIALLGTIDPKLAEGFLHAASGWVIFVATMAVGVILHRYLAVGWQRLHA